MYSDENDDSDVTLKKIQYAQKRQTQEELNVII